MLLTIMRQTMKKLILFTLLWSLPLFSQTEKKDSVSVNSSKKTEFETFESLHQEWEPTLSIPLQFMGNYSAVSKYNMGFKKFEAFSLPNRPSDLMSLLMQKYQKEQDYKLLNTILGTLETSAAAYMAYEHIKKYGLFK